MDTLISLGADLWTVEGAPVRDSIGFDFPTRMCLARLDDGSLWVHSPIALDEDLRNVINDLGPVRYIVAPNDLHHRFIAAWAAAFPTARIYATSGVIKKSPGVVIDETLGAQVPASWAICFDQVLFDGNLVASEAVFFHRASGTVIFTDLLQQMPSGWYKGWRATVARVDLMTGDNPSVPRKIRVAFKDLRKLRKAVAHVSNWPVKKLVMAHGPVVENEAAEKVRNAFRWTR